MFELEKLYNRRQDIHQVFGGQQQGGIATPLKGPYIFVFTGEAGEQHGYHDGYDENGLFIYTGEGQEGDMQFVRGNRAIRDHVENGKELLLFSATNKKGIYRFKGSFVCAGYDDQAVGPDTKNNLRKLIKFQLVPATVFTMSDYEDQEAALPQDEQSLETLRKKAYAAIENLPNSTPTISKRTFYQRCKAVRTYVLSRAKGTCELCAQPAPFFGKDEKPYLEVHHIRQLADDGLDVPLWMAAICPTCHREIHHGKGGNEKNVLLRAHVIKREDNTFS